MIQQPNPFNRKIVLSLIVLLVVTIVSITVLIFHSVTKVNDNFQIAIQNHVEATIKDKLMSHMSLTKDYAYWDDTIKYAFLKQDKEWISDNLGEYLTETFNITDLFIISGQNDLVISLKNGENSKSNYLSINDSALTKLIVKARKSAPIPPVPTSGIIMINNTPALVAVSILTSDYREPFPSPRPVLVMAVRLNQNYLRTMSKQFRLNNLSFTTSNNNQNTETFINIKNTLNQHIGILHWQPEKPGDLVLSEIRPPLLLLVVIITLIVIFIIKMSNSMTAQLNKALKDLTFNAYHDPLTNLANRNFFNELLDKTIHIVKRDNITCAMLYVDLDNFKNINDRFGHKAGDQLLITIADRIKSSIRESDDAARIGGDEFIILLYNVNSRTDIEDITRKVLTNITQPVSFLGPEIKVTASIGVTIIPDDGDDLDLLITKADLALYDSKKQGKNTYNFYSELEYQ